MTPSTTVQPVSGTNQHPWRDGIAVGVSLFWMFLIGLILDFLIFGSNPIDGRVRLGATVILVWQAQQSRVVLIFIAMLVSLANREPTNFHRGDLLSNILYATLALVTLNWISSYDSIRRRSIAWLCSLGIQNHPEQAPNEVKPTALPVLRKIWVVAAPMLAAFAVALIATGILFKQPLRLNERPWLNWTAANQQVLWPGPTLVVLCLGVWIVGNEVFWRRKSPIQFKMILRTMLLKSVYSDIERTVRARLKRKSKQRSKNK